MKLLHTFFLIGFLGWNAAYGQITAAEYFIDEDPGLGMGVSIPASNQPFASLNFDVDLEGLDNGLHIIHARVQNADAKWSLFARKTFFILPQEETNDVVAAEYFFDEDPGIGEGIPLPIASGNSLSGDFDLPVDALAPGLHVVHLRVRDDMGRWSLFSRRLFYVIEEFGEFEISQIEYFIDIDPGLGMGTPLEVTAGQEINTNLDITLPDTLMEGAHVLHLRARNSNGRWSLYAREAFTVDNSVGLSEITPEVDLWPNPTSDELRFKSDKGQIERVRVIDTEGKLLMDERNKGGLLNISHLLPGTYLVQFFTGTSAFSTKVVKL